MNLPRILKAIGFGRIGKMFIPQIFRDLLKQNAETHKKLGELPLLKRLEQPDVTCDQYVAVLKKTYGLYVALEPHLEAAVKRHAIGINFDERRKLPMLERDLAKFGVSGDKLANIPTCQNLPDVCTLSKALGCMAVIEGSTAGATATAKKLACSNLKLTAANGAEFYNNYQDRHNEMRMQFAQVVQDKKVNEPEFLAAGKETFDTFYNWLANGQ